jgi:SAM-dependent methyltransferase
VKLRERIVAVLEERLALMAPARRLRLARVDGVLAAEGGGRSLSLLDAGCGDGLLTLALAKRHPGWTLLGVDRRDDMLDGARIRARARSLDNVAFEAGDLERPLPGGSTHDAVLAIECLSEIPDDALALRMMTAALAPGGLLVVHVPERAWRPILPGSAAIWREQVRQGYDVEGIASALREAGLEQIEVQPTFRAAAAAAQEVRDRIKDAPLVVRLVAFPFLAVAVWAERLGVTWGRPNALIATGRQPSA